MTKPPAPSKLTLKQLDQIMVSDTVAVVRYHKSGKIDKEAEAKEIAISRERQQAEDYQDYRDWYKGLPPIEKAIVAEGLGW